MITTEDEYNRAYDEAVSFLMRNPKPDPKTPEGMWLVELINDLDSYAKRVWYDVHPEGRPLC